MRKDAEQNRGKLIAAARAAMCDHGGDVPFEAIAEQAGVTRGTIYRNFSDRHSLYETVLEHELAIMVAEIEALPGDDLLGFLRRLTEMMMVYDKFLGLLPELPDYRPDGVSEAKIVAAIGDPLARAQVAGALRADLTGSDILLASRMLAAHWRLDAKPDRRTALDDRLMLFMGGLGGANPARSGQPPAGTAPRHGA